MEHIDEDVSLMIEYMDDRRPKGVPQVRGMVCRGMGGAGVVQRGVRASHRKVLALCHAASGPVHMCCWFGFPINPAAD